MSTPHTEVNIQAHQSISVQVLLRYATDNLAPHLLFRWARTSEY
jgi:hypothetical protein